MKDSNILAIVKHPKKPAELREIPNTLKAFQDVIGGYIESVTFDAYVIICDEDGIYKNLPQNIQHPHLCAPIVGTIIICGYNGYDFADIDQDTADHLLKLLNASWAL